MMTTKHPRNLHWFSIVQFFERFSYYGIKSLLILYLVQHLHYSDDKSYAIFGVFGAITYALPLLGGYLADKYLGFYRAICIGCAIILCGHLCIFSFSSDIGFYLGLGLVAMGTGFYKSNMTAFIGTLYAKEDPRKDSAYTIFYIYQNVGAFTAPLICGSLGLIVGWRYGFLAASFGIICSLILLFLLRKRVLKEKIFSSDYKPVFIIMTLALLVSPIASLMIFYGNDIFYILVISSVFYIYIYFKYANGVELKYRKNMYIIFYGILMVAFSGALIDHGETSFTLFMERLADKNFLMLDMPATVIQAIEPFVLVVVGSLFAKFLPQSSSEPRTLFGINKAIIGFFIICGAYILLFLICKFLNKNGLIPILPVAAAIAVLALSDLLIYPIVLSIGSKLSPPHLQGVVMGFVTFGMAIAQLLGSTLDKLAAIPVEILENQKANILIYYQDFLLRMVFIAGAITILILLIYLSLKKSHSIIGNLKRLKK